MTSFTPTTVTVKNQRTSAAGAFTTTVYQGPTARASVQFAGLAPGASATMNHAGNGNGCDGSTWSALADSSNVVPESNEGNNTKTFFDEAPIC